MIVRILGEGQYDLDDHALDALNGLDNQIEQAIEASDGDILTTTPEEQAAQRETNEGGPA